MPFIWNPVLLWCTQCRVPVRLFPQKEEGENRFLKSSPLTSICSHTHNLHAFMSTHTHTHRHICLYARTCALAHTQNKFYKREKNHAKTHAFIHISSIPNTVIGSSLYYPKHVSNLPFQVKNHTKQVKRHLGWTTVFCWCWQKLLLTEQADSTD